AMINGKRGSQDIETGLAVYVACLNAIARATTTGTLEPDLHAIERGRKYARIVTVDFDGSRSARTFVDLATGAVYMAATWRGPTKKTPRGNVLDGSWLEWSNVYGAGYVGDRGEVARYLEHGVADVVRDAVLAGDAVAAATLLEAEVR